MDTPLKFQLNVIDFYCSFEYLLTYRSNEYSDLNPNSYTPNSTVFCPFHPNTESKAAKLYPKDNTTNKSEKLYCFAENRIYFPHSLLSPPKFIEDKRILSQFKSIVPYDPNWVFSAIWNHLPEQDKQYWKAENPEIVINGNTPRFDRLYQTYKQGQIDLFTLLQELNKV